MSLYKPRPFARIIKKAGIIDAVLKASVKKMRKGLIHADLGGKEKHEHATQKRGNGFCS